MLGLYRPVGAVHAYLGAAQCRGRGGLPGRGLAAVRGLQQRRLVAAGLAQGVPGCLALVPGRHLGLFVVVVAVGRQLPHLRLVRLNGRGRTGRLHHHRLNLPHDLLQGLAQELPRLAGPAEKHIHLAVLLVQEREAPVPLLQLDVERVRRQLRGDLARRPGPLRLRLRGRDLRLVVRPHGRLLQLLVQRVRELAEGLPLGPLLRLLPGQELAPLLLDGHCRIVQELHLDARGDGLGEGGAVVLQVLTEGTLDCPPHAPHALLLQRAAVGGLPVGLPMPLPELRAFEVQHPQLHLQLVEPLPLEEVDVRPLPHLVLLALDEIHVLLERIPNGGQQAL
mmetsp:Transcript_136564/g.237039  ORF Transcript_136564/g.237039 Transcript_136564/m.237039 type:complete len:336 (-) Transcript_136564:790-1797(-)